MIRFAANLSMLYPEHSFEGRFAAAASDGFSAVEYLFPYEYKPARLRQLLEDNGLTQVLFNAPPGDWEAGERGIASLAGRGAEFRAGIDRALDYARELRCSQVHVMAGVLKDPAYRIDHLMRYRDRLAWARERAEGTGVRLLVEPLNHRDVPGYLITRQADAHQTVEEVSPDGLGVQLDLYHCQINEGDLATTIERDIPSGRVSHVQIAGVPTRQEPDRGEVDFVYLLWLLDRLDYRGHVGLEYRPAAGTSEGVHRFFNTVRERGVTI